MNLFFKKKKYFLFKNNKKINSNPINEILISAAAGPITILTGIIVIKKKLSFVK